MRIRVGEQPFQILRLLLEEPGHLVTRTSLQQALWPADTFVDFERGLNAAINKLRDVLGDNADNPRFIETLPRRGYRFIAPVQTITGAATSPAKKPKSSSNVALKWLRSKVTDRKGWAVGVGVTSLILAAATFKALPWIARSYNNRGWQLQQQGQLNAAIQDYQRALTLDSSYAAAHYNLADAYEEIPDYDKALQEYQQAINADLTFYEAYNNLSRLYILRRKDYGAALRLLERGLSLKPQEPSVQYSLYKNYGWANLELQNWNRAEQNLRAALVVDPERGPAHCLLAKVLDAQEKTITAITEWEACAAYSNQLDVEPEWRNEAQERLGKQAAQ
jgi:DNA-binding winged helix-turn-helix (wHTH) protein